MFSFYHKKHVNMHSRTRSIFFVFPYWSLNGVHMCFSYYAHSVFFFCFVFFCHLMFKSYRTTTLLLCFLITAGFWFETIGFWFCNNKAIMLVIAKTMVIFQQQRLYFLTIVDLWWTKKKVVLIEANIFTSMLLQLINARLFFILPLKTCLYLFSSGDASFLTKVIFLCAGSCFFTW